MGKARRPSRVAGFDLGDALATAEDLFLGGTRLHSGRSKLPADRQAVFSAARLGLIELH
ncbi:MAG: hypothetical protein ACRDV9_14210 [Acidimicrobiia bacterium]